MKRFSFLILVIPVFLLLTAGPVFADNGAGANRCCKEDGTELFVFTNQQQCTDNCLEYSRRIHDLRLTVSCLPSCDIANTPDCFTMGGRCIEVENGQCPTGQASIAGRCENYNTHACCSLPSGEPVIEINPPKLQIPLFTMKPFTKPFSTPTRGGGEALIIDYIAQYIAGIYRFMVGIAGIMAGIMIVWAGVKWLTSAGAADKITDAKKKIAGAIVGLILVFGSYAILYALNPDLLFLKPLRIAYIGQQLLDLPDSGDENNDLTGDALRNARNVGATCPGEGGAAMIPEIARSFQGKVAYRWNGKGGPPPYSEKPDGRFYEFNDFCPAGQICLDCSGFTNLVLRCAGVRMEPPWGGVGFFLGLGGETVDPASNPDFANNIINGKELEPGDIVGYRKGDTHMVKGKTKIAENSGHVIMYIGNGEVMDSHGTRVGREGKAIRVTKLTRWEGMITRVRRMNVPLESSPDDPR